MRRRTVLQNGLLATSVAAGLSKQTTAAEQTAVSEVDSAFEKPTFVATWDFGIAACERSLKIINDGGSLKDAVERGIHVAELDESNHSVGYGGYPNAEGIVQLDACFMDGEKQKAGSVAALQGYANPISVARRVMENTQHVMLVGDDAAAFAERSGFKSQNMLTKEAERGWIRWKQQQAQGVDSRPLSHDTIALLGIDAAGHLVGGCSTSGLAFKMPGRVGDSPIIGSGLYVDGSIGAAGATGVGENIMRYCGCFLIVEFMRQGMSPTEACQAAIRRIAEGEQRIASDLSINFVALNKAGEVGAAGTDDGFQCAAVDKRQSLLIRPAKVL